MQVGERVVVWVLAAVAVSAPRVPSLWTYLSLARHGVLSEGVVTRFQPEQHNRAYYRYVVDGRVYEGAADLQHDVREGGQVDVYYLAKDPNTAVLGSPRRVLYHEAISTAWAVILLPPVAVFFAGRARRKQGVA
jgi:hypothetical protein